MYYSGKGVEQNYAEAAKWFQKAAEQGCSVAQSNLEECYKYIDNTSMDMEKARYSELKAAERELNEIINSINNIFK